MGALDPKDDVYQYPNPEPYWQRKLHIEDYVFYAKAQRRLELENRGGRSVVFFPPPWDIDD